jgi:peroxiredoxin
VRKALVLGACALLLAACTGRSGVNTDSGTSPQLKTVGGLAAGVFRVEDRRQAPEISGETLDGGRLDLDQFAGKVVVLNFWAQWCAPCRAEARNLNAVYAQTKASGVEFVGVNIKDDRTAARAMVRSKNIAYPSLFDPNGLLLLKFRGQAPQSPPTTLVLDRKGRVAARFLQGVTETQLLIPVRAIAAEAP